MGNGMMCITTPKTGVMQGVANTVNKGAAPPPPPTGAVGGGDALHLSAVVVLQMVARQMVPMPPFKSAYVTGGITLAFSLPKKSGEGLAW